MLSSLIAPILIFFVVHTIIGRVTAYLWQLHTDIDIDKEDLKAIRVLWFVFAPIGLSVALVSELNKLMNDVEEWDAPYYSQWEDQL